MKKSIIAKVAEMKVAEMREVAGQYGIKNASKHRRVELAEMLVNAMLVEAKKAKVVSKKDKANTETNKRYKASKVNEGEIEVLADEIIEDKITGGLFDVNRKVLIAVMKKLGCEKWYRTYDKPTMVDKIVTTMIAA